MPGYHSWEKHVRRVLLYSMTAGAVERGEAKISICYDDLFNAEVWLDLPNSDEEWQESSD